jgi:hypothetical protein
VKKNGFVFVRVLALLLVFGFVLAGCGSKDPLEGTWTTVVEGETVTAVFYGGKIGLDALGNGMSPYVFEKNVGTIDTGYGDVIFNLSGKTIKINILGLEFSLTKDAKTTTPKALAGEWIADDGSKLAFMGNLVISTDEDGDTEFGSYTFENNQGEFDDVFFDTFIVSDKTLTVDPENDYYKKVFTLGGKK